MRTSFLILFLVLCGLAGPGIAPARAAGGPAILVVGDSLSAGYGLRPGQGWVSLLEDRLSAQGYEYRVVNASVSGETTVGGLERLPRALEKHRPAVVILELGANDGLRGLPVAELEANLESMIQMSRTAGAKVLLTGIRIPVNYGPRYAEQFFAVYGELTQRYKLALVPFILEGIGVDETMFQADGIHPNPEAQAILLDNVWSALRPLLGH